LFKAFQFAMSTEIDAAELLKTCEAAARAGGDELMRWHGRFETREKGVCDFVTDADMASQRAIQEVVVSRFPNHAFLGEEQSPDARARTIADDQVVWIADPLDGTTNYIHGYPNYAVSVAVSCGQRLLAGVIFDPVHKDCYRASAGCGAWLNGKRLRVSKTQMLAHSLVGVSLPARVRRESPDLLDFIEIVQLCQAVRRSGSAALNLAHVASGMLDAFWASHIQPWDVAAGMLLIREAGGTISGRDGSTFNLWKPHFITASTPELHRELAEKLTPYAGAPAN
jgi:myo-inositol-1(or 4)-monophosphatase